MNRAAFITGSRAYGTPHEYSDLDLVIETDTRTAEKLATLPQNPGSDFTGKGSFSAKFGNLNLIVCLDTCPKAYDTWAQGTKTLELQAELLERRMTRDEAKALFTSLRKTAGLL